MAVTLEPMSIPAGPAPAASSGQGAAGGSGGMVLVLNSGSSSVKFALLLPGSGERLMGGMGERLGTPEATLRVQWFPAAAVTERLPGASHQAVVARVLDHLAEAGHSDAHLLGAGHRVVHGGERFTSSIRVDDAVLAAVRSFSHLAPLHNPANLAGIEAVRAVLPDLPQVAVRSRVLGRLAFLGLAEDVPANAGHGRRTGGRISVAGPVLSLAVPTDEELLIARDTARVIAADPQRRPSGTMS